MLHKGNNGLGFWAGAVMGFVSGCAATIVACVSLNPPYQSMLVGIGVILASVSATFMLRKVL